MYTHNGAQDNILDLCRLCLVRNHTLRPIFDPLQDSLNEYDVLEKIRICLPVQINREDQLSKQVCEDCIEKVEDFYEYRCNIVRCQEVLESLLGNTVEQCTERETDDESSNCSSYSCDNTNVCVVKEEFDENGLVGSVDEEEPEEEEYATDVGEVDSVESSIDNDEAEECLVQSEILIDVDVIHNDCSYSESSQIDPLDVCADNQGNSTKRDDSQNNKTTPSSSPKKVSEAKRSKSSYKPINSKDYSCDVCKKKFKTLSQLCKHKTIHNKQFICGECPYISKCGTNFKIHMLKHNGNYLINCKVCSKGFYNISYYKEHFLSKHTNEICVYKCSLCNQTFRSKDYLKLHIRNHKERSFMDKSFQCHVCGKIFKSWKGLKRHLLITHENSRYRCDECGKQVTCLKSLKNHKMTHGGQKSYVCEICGKGFIAHNNLIVHKRIHSGEKPYSCDECNKSFSQKITLIVHKRYHSGEKPFQCNLCNKRFVNKSHLKSHGKTHSTT